MLKRVLTGTWKQDISARNSANRYLGAQLSISHNCLMSSYFDFEHRNHGSIFLFQYTTEMG